LRASDCGVDVSMNALTDVYETNRRFLWAVCYRMTGNHADADEIVQDTFLQALQKPPCRYRETVATLAVARRNQPEQESAAAKAQARLCGELLPAPSTIVRSASRSGGP